jgi:hypothetical protein
LKVDVKLFFANTSQNTGYGKNDLKNFWLHLLF